MSAHTKGPWQKRLIEYEQGDQVGWSIEAGDGRGANYIADVHMHSGPARNDARDEANADLVAAAPQMREALQTTLGNLRSLKNNAFRQLDTLDEWIATIEAALAKATTTQRSALPPRTGLYDGDKEVAT